MNKFKLLRRFKIDFRIPKTHTLMTNKLHFGVTLLTLITITIISCTKTNDFVDPAKILPPALTNGRSYYVSDALGSDGNDGLTLTSTLKTINAAYTKVVAGDSVLIMNGTYTGGTVLNILKSGTAAKYITFKNFPGHTPKILITGNVYQGISINGSYIIIQGLEMQGDNANITYAAALASYNTAVAGGTDPNQGAYNTGGISIGGPRSQTNFPHHVVIRNCKIHDFPGGGLGSIQADYSIFEGNTIYNNCWYTMYAGSGISILTPFNSDGPDITKYKNIVRNNIVYGNKTTIPWISATPARLSDGNGIILDINQFPYGGSAASNNPYTGRTLAENNVSFNNGGSGIHSYRADHVDIINNTTFGNGTNVGYPEIFANSATDVKIINNIMYSRSVLAGGKCNSVPNSGTSVTYNYNIYFNGTVAVQGANDRIADPLFVTLSIDPLLANFSLSSGSPAIDAGSSTIFSLKDIKGVSRPKGAGVDCGAYEY